METIFARRSVLGLLAGTIGGVLALGLSRAGHANQGGTPAPSPLASPVATIDHPSGAEDLVLRIATVGGFVPVAQAFSDLPDLSLYGDGRVITGGPQIAIFPPPALPNLLETVLAEEGIQAILAAANEAGLIGESRSYDNSTVADVQTTVFTVQAGGTVTTVAAYALGFGDDPNWSADERRELALLQSFLNEVIQFHTWLPPSAFVSEGGFYSIERLQVVAVPRSVLPPADANDPSLNQPEIEWPLSTPLSAYTALDVAGTTPPTRCGDVEGADFATLLPAAREANELTPWISEGEAYLVSFRPLLPDEQGCPPQSNVAATPEA